MSKFPSAKVTTDVLYGKSFCVRMDQDAYIEFRCEQLMDMIRSARMKEEYVDIETKRKGLQRFLNQIADLSAIACQGY